MSHIFPFYTICHYNQNQLMKNISLFCLLSFFTFSLIGQSHWDEQQFKEIKVTYRMSQNGDSVGFTSIHLYQNNQQWILHEIAEVPNLSEDIKLYVKLGPLSVDSVIIGGKMSGFPIECRANWDGLKVTGFSDFPRHPSRPTIHIDTTLEAEVIERATSFWLSPFYKELGSGFSKKYLQFNTMSGQINPITANWTSDESIEIDGKNYQTHRVELRGGVASQNVYYDTQTKQIIKIDFEENDWVYEMVK